MMLKHCGGAGAGDGAGGWAIKCATVAVLVLVLVLVVGVMKFTIVGLRFCVWTFADGEHVVSH